MGAGCIGFAEAVFVAFAEQHIVTVWAQPKATKGKSQEAAVLWSKSL
jgi:hypothetical protein